MLKRYKAMLKRYKAMLKQYKTMLKQQKAIFKQPTNPSSLSTSSASKRTYPMSISTKKARATPPSSPFSPLEQAE